MSNIKVTDGVTVLLNVEPNELAPIAKYFPALDHIGLQAPAFIELFTETVDQVANNATVSTGISTQKPVTTNSDLLSLNVSAEASGSLTLLKADKDKDETALLDSDPEGEGIRFKKGQCYLSISLNASTSAGFDGASGKLNFGIEPGTSAQFTCYRRFEPRADTLFSELVRDSIANYSIPLAVDDLRSMDLGTVTTADYNGKLKISASADLLAVTNPLASVELPASLGSVGVTSGGKVSVSASYELTGGHQIRVHKRGPNEVMLGYYRKTGSTGRLGVTASAGVTANFGEFELFSLVLRKISPDAEADESTLQNGGLSPERIAAIRDAVKTGIDRKLQTSLSDQLSLLKSSEAAFLFHIDLSSLDEIGSRALTRALQGDLTGLPDNGSTLPAGIRRVKSIFTETRKRRNVFKVNLLGVLNVFSIGELTLTGRVMVDEDTGEVTILDRISATRIQGVADNFRLDGEGKKKLRRLLAESFLLTVAYSACAGSVAAPELRASHSFFRLSQHANRHNVVDYLELAAALDFATAPLPRGLDEFGPVTVDAETSYGPTLTPKLFLNSTHRARTVEEYERVGLNALLAVVRSDDEDKWRRIPAEHPSIFKEMKRIGNAQSTDFRNLFPSLSADLQVPAIGADYLTIEWWAESMHRLGLRLEKMQAFLLRNPGIDLKRDPAFSTLRDSLSEQLKQVASDTREEFGEAWGLVAMYLASGGRAGVSVRISNAKLPGGQFSGQRDEQT